MTRVNPYLWHLPHETEAQDPPEVAALATAFNEPIVEAVSDTLSESGYELSASDVLIKLDEVVDGAADQYQANVRFVKYLQPDIMTRVHFQHGDWALFLSDPDAHRFYINLDRFKTIGEAHQTVPAWKGRLHTRLSSVPGDAFFFEGMDQQWSYGSPNEFERQMGVFLDKFERLVVPWLENLTGSL